jgi:hypothetical protein
LRRHLPVRSLWEIPIEPPSGNCLPFFHAWELHLVPSSRLAFIGNSLPRQCGIATFTTDLQQAVAKSRAHIETAIVAMTDHGHTYSYPGAVRLQINDEQIEEYERAADFLNAGHFHAVSLQH